MPKQKTNIVMVGKCPKCGKEFYRPYPCDIAVCDCESVRLIPLEPAMVIDDKSYAKLSKIAKIADVSVDRVFEVLFEVSEKELMRKGLLNLLKR